MKNYNVFFRLYLKPSLHWKRKFVYLYKFKNMSKHMKTKAILYALLFASTTAFGQNITKEDLREIRGSFVKDAPTKAAQNILTQNANISANAIDLERNNEIDHFFKYRVKVSGITNQKQSGRCWMFTSMNALRPSIMEKFDIKNFDFSHNYLYFWDMFEKSNLFLENIIATKDKPMDDRAVSYLFSSPVGDGGVWNLYLNVAKKYGVVPKEVMPETAHSENTTQLLRLMKESLRRSGYNLREMAVNGAKSKDLQVAKKEALKDIYRLLALCLGEPPTDFTWRYKDKTGKIVTLESTPNEFYRSITPEDYNPENYIMIMNDPTREYYKIYEIDNYKNTIEGINWIYLNLPIEDIKTAALESIKNNEAMYSSSDVGKFLNREKGILDPKLYDYESLLGIKLDMEKKARILTRQSGSSHAMLLIGCDTDQDGKPVKWEFENSWGMTGNNGYLTFTDEWFNEYIFRVVIHRRFLDDKAIKSLDQKPIKLPMWDYMN